MNSLKKPPQLAYEAYAKSTGGKTFDGREMPKWADLPERIQTAWCDATAAALLSGLAELLEEAAREVRRENA